MRSSTETIVATLRHLAKDKNFSQRAIKALASGTADRLEEIHFDNKCFENQHTVFNHSIAEYQQTVEKLTEQLAEAEAYSNKLVQHKDMICLPKDLENLREANGKFAEEIQGLENECTRLAQYIRVLQEENEPIENKLKEQSDNGLMKKFAMNLDKLKDEVLFELIIRGSAVAVGYEYKTFYTNSEGMPHDWYNTLIDDIRNSTTRRYEGERFNVVYASGAPADYCNDTDEQDDLLDDSVAYIFYQDRVFTFDAYFTDCEIFQQVVKSH